MTDYLQETVDAMFASITGDGKNYLVWSNEHRAWWGPNRAGYYSSIAAAGRYTRDEALKICVGARGGRQFNKNPSETPVLLADAEIFWPDDQPEWREERLRREREEDEYEERTRASY